MSGEKREKSQKLEPDELIEQLVPDPANPEVKKLVGFLLGRSNREEYWRLYLTAGLNHYLEFLKEDTLHAQQFPSGRTLVWVKPETRVQETRIRSTPAEFLRGNILNNHLSSVTSISGLRQMLGVGAFVCCPPNKHHVTRSLEECPTEAPHC